MKRRALIIGNPGEAGTPGYCQGVNRDMDNYPRFLQSPNGGLWDKGDIELLIKPQAQSVRNAIRKFEAADYGFVVFTGHGCHSASQNSTILELRENEKIDSAELRRGAAKQTLVLDCCRVVTRELLEERAFFKAMAERPPLHPQDCLRYYNNSIEECPPGLVVINACAIGEVANDDSQKGGYYSYNLISGAAAWANNNSIDTTKNYSVLSIVAAHEEARSHVSRLSGGRQNPQIEKPRSEKYFPFCIVA